MKGLLVVFAVCLLLEGAYSDSMDFMKKMMECGQEMGITPQQMKEMATTKDEKLGCVSACVLKKLGGMVDGKLHEENMFSMLDEHKESVADFERMKDVLKHCHDEAMSGGELPECDLAGKFAACMHSHLHV